MNNLKYICLSVLLGIFSCNKHEADPAEEDYAKLFPLKPIEKPESAYEDMRIRLCNPDEAIQSYRYQGVMISNPKEYEVTVKCKFREGTDARYARARFVVRFVGEDTKLKTIGSNTADSSLNYTMEEDKEFTFRYKVKSGFPMYLSVNGVGDRGSNISASIMAVSTDGLVVVPSLSSQQSQNQEGPNRIPNPYCEYIILP